MTDSSTSAEPSDLTGAQLQGPPQLWPAPPQPPVARSPKLGRVAMVMAICVISASVLTSVLLGLFGTTIYEYRTGTSAGFNMRPDQAWFTVQMLLGSIVGIWALTQGIVAAAQNRGQGGDYGANIPVAHEGMNTGVDVLSDTMGVDFSPYLRRILREIYNTWLPLIPEEARPPLNKQGETLIRFSILPDGRIGSMHLDGSTQDQAIDRAAWGSITGVGQFPPLPKEFHGPNLELRIHYLVNKRPE